MKIEQFKTGLKEVSNQLRGLTLMLMNSNSAIPYKSLNAFGLAVLQEEKDGCNIIIRNAHTKTGIVEVTSFDHLKELLNTSAVTAIVFQSIYSAATFEDYLRNIFGTND